jgi:ABC-type bacteriocin/lantibiotic exporter with double-glycine peptidase domain
MLMLFCRVVPALIILCCAAFPVAMWWVAESARSTVQNQTLASVSESRARTATTSENADIVDSTDEFKNGIEEAQETLLLNRQLVAPTGDLARYTSLLFWATFALAILTLGLVTVGFFQVRQAKTSIGAAVTSATVAERALAVLERISVSV